MAFHSSTTLIPSDREPNGKFAIDVLFEKQRQRNERQMRMYNQILERVHRQIRKMSLSNARQQFLLFLVPPFLLNEPHYHLAECIAHLTQSLDQDGFEVRLREPNALHISWAHWIPDYVRQEFFKQTGSRIDGRGTITTSAADPAAEDAAVSKPAAAAKDYLSAAKVRPGADVYPAEYFDHLNQVIGHRK